MADKISCSCTWGRGNINHNFSQYSRNRQEHIDPNKTSQNIILKEINPKNVEKKFNEIFADDVAEYNKNQKRKDRQIKSYYQKVLNDKKIKAPFREVIFQVGNKEDAKDPIKKEKMVNALISFYNEFEKNYPRLKVLGAVIHMDEATPHMHIDVVPYAENNKKGLKHKVSFEKAIEQMGFEPEISDVNETSKKPLIFNGFRNHSMQLLESILNDEGMQRDIKHNNKKHLEPAEYREKMAIEDLKKQPEIQEKAINELGQDSQIRQEAYNRTTDEFKKRAEKLQQDNDQLNEKNKYLQGIKKSYSLVLKTLNTLSQIPVINKIIDFLIEKDPYINGDLEDVGELDLNSQKKLLEDEEEDER